MNIMTRSFNKLRDGFLCIHQDIMEMDYDGWGCGKGKIC